MMLPRATALLIILSQLILLRLVWDTNGLTATVYSFVGHPLLGAGILLAIAAMLKRGSE